MPLRVRLSTGSDVKLLVDMSCARLPCDVMLPHMAQTPLAMSSSWWPHPARLCICSALCCVASPSPTTGMSHVTCQCPRHHTCHIRTLEGLGWQQGDVLQVFVRPA